MYKKINKYGKCPWLILDVIKITIINIRINKNKYNLENLNEDVDKYNN